MNTQTPTQQIIDIINDMTETDLICLNAEYCEACNYSGNDIYNNDEQFFEDHFSGNIMEVVRAISYGDYDYHHDYVIFNGYGNLESFSRMDTERLCERVETMAEYIAENLHEFTQFDNVEEIEEEEEEEEETEENQ
jgi:hypothetical protein